MRYTDANTYETRVINNHKLRNKF